MSADGILIINKSSGKTSRQVTSRVGKIMREKKAGHLGTLDPAAAGVLPIALGQATRLLRYLEAGDKTYRAVIRLGAATNTHDAEGEVVLEGEWRGLGPGRIRDAVASFQGEILQTPPMYSAVKVEGTPLYKLARRGIEVERRPRPVTIHAITVEDIELPDLTVKIVCSPGTYVRVITHELGSALGCGAHLLSLVRSSSGPFSIEDAVSLDDLDEDLARRHLIPPRRCLPQFRQVIVDAEQAAMVRDGMTVKADDPGIIAGTRFSLISEDELVAVALAVASESGVMLKPERVMRPAP